MGEPCARCPSLQAAVLYECLLTESIHSSAFNQHPIRNWDKAINNYQMAITHTTELTLHVGHRMCIRMFIVQTNWLSGNRISSVLPLSGIVWRNTSFIWWGLIGQPVRTAPTVTPLSKDWISRDNRRSGGREWGEERTGVVGKKEAISLKNGRRKRRD